ncbi:MAG: leucine-rich repeat protein [Clostridia bacterium]|nr:leucine-rich repeat protein [Clostridia bacterium]
MKKLLMVLLLLALPFAAAADDYDEYIQIDFPATFSGYWYDSEKEDVSAYMIMDVYISGSEEESTFILDIRPDGTGYKVNYYRYETDYSKEEYITSQPLTWEPSYDDIMITSSDGASGVFELDHDQTFGKYKPTKALLHRGTRPDHMISRVSGEWRLAQVEKGGAALATAGYPQKLYIGEDYTFSLMGGAADRKGCYMVRDGMIMMDMGNQLALLKISEDFSTVSLVIDGSTHIYSRDGVSYSDVKKTTGLAGTYWAWEEREFGDEIRRGLYFKADGTAVLHEQEYNPNYNTYVSRIDATWQGNDEEVKVYYRDPYFGNDETLTLRRINGPVFYLEWGSKQVFLVRQDLDGIMPRIMGQWEMTGRKAYGADNIVSVDEFAAYNEFRGYYSMYKEDLVINDQLQAISSYVDQEGAPRESTANIFIYAGQCTLSGESILLSDGDTAMEVPSFNSARYFSRVSLGEWAVKPMEKIRAQYTQFTGEEPPAVSGADIPASIPEPTATPNPDAAYFQYKLLDDGTAAITKYTGFNTHVRVPAEMDGHAVTRIEDFLFSGSGGLVSVTLPDGITAIGRYAFQGCSSLTEVNIPDTVTQIGSRAFYGCSSLESIYIPASVTDMAGDAFGECKKLTAIVVPGSQAEGDCRWDGVKYTYAVTVSDNEGDFEYELTYSGDKAEITNYKGQDPHMVIPHHMDGYLVTQLNFWKVYDSGNREITGVTLPSGITSLSSNPFYNFPNLQEIHTARMNMRFKVMDQVLFHDGQSKDPGKIDCVGRVLVCYPRGLNADSYTVPKETFSVARFAFANCDQLRSVVISDNVYNIGSFVFSGCKNLEEVELSYRLETIPSYTFSGCSSLKKVILPGNLKEIDYSAFEYCTSLETLFIPASVTEIDEYAFYGCEKLTLYVAEGSYAESFCKENGARHIVYRPDSSLAASTASDEYAYQVLHDGTIAITQYTGTAADLVIPSVIDGWKVSAIGDQAFMNNKTIKSVSIPEGVTSIGRNAFTGSSVQQVRLPSTMRILHESAFRNAEKLQSINLPQGLEVLSDSVFNNANLSEITIPGSVKEIGSYAFYSCGALKEVTVEEGVQFIGECAFASCEKLKTVVLPASVTEMEKNVFSYNKQHSITVPKDSYAQQYCKDNELKYKTVANAGPVYVAPTQAPVAQPTPAPQSQSNVSVVRPTQVPQTKAPVTQAPALPQPVQVTQAPAVQQPVQATQAPAVSQPVQPAQVPQPTAVPIRQPMAGTENAYEIPARFAAANSYIASTKNDFRGGSVLDGNPETCWQFSTKKIKLGDAALEITLQQGGTVDELWIKNGFWKYTDGNDQYTRNCRPKKIGVSFRYEGESGYRDEIQLTLKDDKQRMDWQIVPLGRHEQVAAVRIRVISIYSGTKYKTDVAISEVKFVEREGASAAAAPAPQAPAAAYQTLKRGNKGDEVLAMKMRMQELGYFTPGAQLSNSYNDTCVERVKQFQKRNGLPRTGIADEQTLALLYSDAALPKE